MGVRLCAHGGDGGKVHLAAYNFLEKFYKQMVDCLSEAQSELLEFIYYESLSGRSHT